MDMKELIEMIYGCDNSPVLYTVELEDFSPIQTQNKSVSFVTKDEVISFLFDYDLFGWQAKEWNYSEFAYSYATLTIKLFRLNA